MYSTFPDNLLECNQKKNKKTVLYKISFFDLIIFYYIKFCIKSKNHAKKFSIHIFENYFFYKYENLTYSKREKVLQWRKTFG